MARLSPAGEVPRWGESRLAANINKNTNFKRRFFGMRKLYNQSDIKKKGCPNHFRTAYEC